MKKKISLFLLCGLLLIRGIPVHAETFYGDETWNVTFNRDNEMASSFKTSDINDVVSGMQPGDNVIITLSLKNDNETATDWYMKNEVLYSLEDRSANGQTKGGAYTYRLSYQSSQGGEENVLFDSDTVGGDSTANGEGLHKVSNSLEDYLFLDTLSPGQKGTVSLKVSLDGETQGNGYQNTFANLQINFAVEPDPDQDNPGGGNPGGGGNTPRTVRRTGSGTGSGSTLYTQDRVYTGDNDRILIWSSVALVSGLGLLIYAVICHRKKQGREES